MKRRLAITLIIVAFGAGTLTMWLWSGSSPAPMNRSGAGTAPQNEREVLYWHDPMVPGPRFDKPGKSPFMDMQLVPVYADEAQTGNQAIVTVRPEIVNSLGVRVYKVERMRLSRRAVTHGYLLAGGNGGALTAQVDIFDRDADWVRVNMPARLTVDALPGESFPGSVVHIDPDIGIGARTLKADVRIARRDARLKPNMFAEVVIEAPAAGAYLAIPREAVIRTGQRTAVILALGSGRFQPVDVMVGREVGEFIEIQTGIKEGDSVVVSGQFLIDSEASLRAAFRRLSPVEAEVNAPLAPLNDQKR
jgi:membrane fusion protein, copper/silver efflux system